MCYLDEDPVAVATPIAAVLADRWEGAAIEPAFAAPFVSLQPFDYERHTPTRLRPDCDLRRAVSRLGR